MSFNSTLNPFLGSPDFKLGFLDGYVTINPGGAVVGDTIKGVACAKTGTGQYTFSIAPDIRGLEIKFCNISLIATSAVDLVPQILSQSPSSVVVQLLAGSTPTNPSVPCGLNFILLATDSRL